jgi:hypothetical protein
VVVAVRHSGPMRVPIGVGLAVLLSAACALHSAVGTDLRSNAWTALRATGDGPDYGGLPGRRSWIQVAYNSDSKTVLMFGGDADTYLSDLWEYSVSTNRWHLLRSHPDQAGPCRRDNHNFVYDAGRKRLWMWNGAIGDNSGRNTQPGCGQQENNQDQWTYDPSANSWTRRGRSPERMLAAGAAYDPVTETILQFGGDRGLSSNTTDWTFLMDAATGRWTRLSGFGSVPPPSTNIQGGLVYMPPVKKFLLFGGRNGSASTLAYNQTWTFDPARRQWKRVNPTTSPPARDLHSLVFDTTNGVAILRGGRSADRSTVLGDTWVFDPVKEVWTNVTSVLTDPGPPTHYGNGVYDTANKIMLLVPGDWSTDTLAFRYRPVPVGE